MDVKSSRRLTFACVIVIFLTSVLGSAVYVDKGSTVTLVCPFNADQMKTIDWYGPPNLEIILSVGSGINPALPEEQESRLSIIGDFNSGEYNLQIKNIQPSDEDRYRCQGISGGTLNFTIFNLFIRVAPLSNPAISIDPAGNIIAGSNIKLICMIPGGKPLASISWKCTGSGQAGNGSNSNTSISTVQLVVNKIDQGKTCQCIGSHPLWPSDITANITMDIKYVPDDNLSIKQFPSGGIIRGTQIRLTCSVTGGNPLATLTWNCNGTTTNETTGNTASYSVTFIVNKAYDKRICTCSATHVVTSYSPNVTHTLVVYYEPIHDPLINQTPPGYIISGKTVKLTCEVSGGNPLAILSWNCTGTNSNNTSVTKASYSVDLVVDRTSNNRICACLATHRVTSYTRTVLHVLVVYYIPDNDPVVKQEPAGGIIAGRNVTLRCTVSGGNPLATLSWNCSDKNINNTIGTTASNSIEITVDKTYNGRTCTCSATHPIPSYRPSMSHMLIVYYVPEGNLTVQQEPKIGIINHHKVKLMCSLSGGNPLAILSWDCKGNFTNSTISTTSEYSVEFIVEKNDNNRFCTCTARHMISSYSTHIQHKLVVFYAPVSIPSIRQIPDGGIVNGTSVLLTCAVAGGNPLATLVWNCSGTEINNTAGNNASYSVAFTLNEKDNKKICACSTIHPDTSNLHTVHHELVVYFGPGLPHLVSEPVMPWFEGNITSLKCIYEEGNPVATIEWKRENNLQVAEHEPVFKLGEVTKEDLNASIICMVSNDYGKVESDVLYLNIEYYPRIELEKQKIIVEGENLSVSCNATGNPSPIVSWKKNSGEMKEATIKKSVLSIEDIDRYHDGNYTCKAMSRSQKYGNLISEKDIIVVVYFPPDVTVSKDLSEVYEDEVLTLSCNADGKPTNYTYVWRQTFEGIDIRTLPSVDGRLILTGLSYYDIGKYECFVNNGIRNRHGTLNQTNHTIVELQFSPVFVLFDKVTTGKSSNNVTSAVDFISYPDISKPVQWRNATVNSILVNNINMLITLERKPVQVKLYGISVSFDKYGYRSSLHFPSFEEKQDGFYNLMINNSVGVNNVTIRIVLSDRPKPPTNFLPRVIGNTEVTLTWKGGFNGGNNQTFVITYWKLHSIDSKDIMIPENDELYYELVISDLKPSTTYVFYINATNSEGYSDSVNNTIVLSTIDISDSESSIVGTVGGAVGGIAAAALIVIPVVVFLRKRQALPAKKTDRKNLTVTSTDEEEDNCLKDNVLYESAGENFKANPGQSGAVYAVVNKSNAKQDENGQIQETGLYAEITKKTVQSNKGEAYGNARLKSKGKLIKKGKLIEQKENHDDVYENVTEKTTTKKIENMNKDGLVYADLVFKDDGKRKFIIRGLENKTDYADIDLDLKADPLPSDESDTEEDNARSKEK